MKLVLSLFLLGSTFAAQAVELSAASNRQIMQELSRRLEAGPVGGDSAIVTYLCDSSGYLKMETLTNTGTSKSESKYLSDTTKCEDQAKLLRQNKAKIYGTSLMALCDTSGYLHKITVNEKGEFKSLSSTYLSSYEACLPQAKAINAQQ